MSSLHPSSSPARIVAVAAAAALVALAVVVRYGFDTAPAARGPGLAPPAASAPRGGSADATAALAELARNADVVALVRDPGFAATARFMRLNPELARLIAADDAPALAIVAPETARAMERNAEGMQAAQRAAGSARAALDAIEAQKILAVHPEVNRYANWLGEMSKVAPWRAELDKSEAGQLPALNAAFARRLAARSAAAAEAMATTSADVEAAARASPELQTFLRESTDAIRLATPYAQAAEQLAGSSEVVELAARDVRVIRPPMASAEAARALQDAGAVKLLRAHKEGVLALLATPGAARLLQDPEAVRAALAAASEGATR